MVKRSYRYRLRPTRRQEVALERAGHARRFVYNWALERSRAHFAATGRGITLKQQCRDLTRLKKHPDHAWLREVDSQALQQPIFDLRRAYVAFFERRSRHPRFRSRKSDQLRFRIPQRIRLEGERVYVPSVGWVRLRLSRPVVGEIKSATFKRDHAGAWFVALVAEAPTPPPCPVPVRAERAVGIDLGVVEFAVLSDGRRVESPRFWRKSRGRLRRRHRELSRKQRGSRNRLRARQRLAREYAKTRNRRFDFLHKLSSELIDGNDLICIEDLGVSGLARTKLARAIHDSGFREFRRQLEYKARWHGKHVIPVPRFFPSSKLCNRCGVVNRDLSPRERTWQCDCGEIHDRDLNAARNIVDFGLRRVAVGPTDTVNACEADVRLPTGAAGDEAGIRSAEGQHASALPCISSGELGAC